MSQRNEAPVLVVSLLATVGLIGGGVWWLMRSGVNPSCLVTTCSGPPPPAVPPVTGDRFQDIAPVPSGVFNYGGSTTWAPIRGQVDPEIQKVWTAFQLRYTDPVSGTAGSANGIRMLLDHQLAFAQSSRPLNAQDNQQAAQRGIKLQEIPVALEGIAIAVNPALNLPGLTIDQLKGIYSGQITNWNQVGGPDQAIVAYSRRPEDSGTVEFMVNDILGGNGLGGNNLGSKVQFVNTTTEAIRAVSTNAGSIYYASAPEIVGQCGIQPLPIGRHADQLVAPYQPPLVPVSACPSQRNHLNTEALQNGQYPLTRQLFVIVRQDGQADQQAGEAYARLLLTRQGQELIAKSGFVRLH